MATRLTHDLLRPRDLSLLLLASKELSPRRRARDQQADRAGMTLKRRLLDRLAALDPDPEETEATLLRIVEDFGPPTGPTRALALSILEDWRQASTDPAFLHHLMEQALHP